MKYVYAFNQDQEYLKGPLHFVRADTEELAWEVFQSQGFEGEWFSHLLCEDLAECEVACLVADAVCWQEGSSWKDWRRCLFFNKNVYDLDELGRAVRVAFQEKVGKS